MDDIRISLDTTGAANDISVVRVDGVVDTMTASELERVMNTLSGKPCDRVPVCAVLGAYAGGRIGADLRDLYTDAEVYVRGQVALQEAFGFDMVLAPFDFAAIAEAHNVKASVGNVGDRVEREIVHETRVDDRAEFAFGQARLQIGNEDACGFE